MALEETGGVDGVRDVSAPEMDADVDPSEADRAGTGTGTLDGDGRTATDRAADGAGARDVLGSPAGQAVLADAAAPVGGTEGGSDDGSSGAPVGGAPLGGPDAAPVDPDAPYAPTPPPDSFMQRMREGVASGLGRTVGEAQAIGGWAGDMIGGAAAAVEAGYEAAVSGIEAATDWIGDEYAQAQRDDLTARAEGLRAAAEEVLSDPAGVARAFAESYEARYAQANALEGAYRSGHADLSAYREAERIRGEAGAELAILGVETGAIALGGAGAIAKGLRAARIADRLDDATPLAMAMAQTQGARDGMTAIERLEVAPGRPTQFDVADIDDELFLMSAGSRGGRVYPDELVARVVGEVEALGGEVRRTDVDAEGAALLDRLERMNGSQINAGTYGDIVFVRPEHAADVRTLLEELEHVKQNLDGRARDAQSSLDLEIDARERLLERAEEFGIPQDVIDETLREIEIMRKRGYY